MTAPHLACFEAGEIEHAFRMWGHHAHKWTECRAGPGEARRLMCSCGDVALTLEGYVKRIEVRVSVRLDPAAHVRVTQERCD